MLSPQCPMSWLALRSGKVHVSEVTISTNTLREGLLGQYRDAHAVHLDFETEDKSSSH